MPGTTDNFDGFSERARKAIVLAQEHARVTGATEADVSCLLLGILSTDRSGVMQDVLGVTQGEVGGDVYGRRSGMVATTERAPGFDSTTIRAFAEARREATDLHHTEVDIRHLLLGVLNVLAMDATTLTQVQIRCVEARNRVRDWLSTGRRDATHSNYPRQT